MPQVTCINLNCHNVQFLRNSQTTCSLETDRSDAKNGYVKCKLSFAAQSAATTKLTTMDMVTCYDQGYKKCTTMVALD